MTLEEILAGTLQPKTTEQADPLPQAPESLPPTETIPLGPVDVKGATEAPPVDFAVQTPKRKPGTRIASTKKRVRKRRKKRKQTVAGMMRKKASKARDDQRLQRDAKIWFYRLSGKSNDEISRILDIPSSTVNDAFKRWRTRQSEYCLEAVEAEKSILLGRLEFCTSKLFAQFMGALAPDGSRLPAPPLSVRDLATLTAEIRANVETFARMCGHNAPTVTVNRQGDPTPQEANNLVREHFGRVTPQDAARLLGRELEPGGEPVPDSPEQSAPVA